MKKWLLLCGWLGLLQPNFAQTDAFKFPDIPVSMTLPPGFNIERIGQKAWEVSDGKTVFNVLQYWVSNLYTADSLKQLVLSLYDDPSIENFQISQVGSGSLGSHPSEKCVVSFRGGGTLYLGTYYLVRFYVNKNVNSFLFFYDIGEAHAPSYTMLLEGMGSSLKNTDFVFATYTSTEDSVHFKYPHFWEIKMNDSLRYQYTSTDNRAFASIGHFPVADSVDSDVYADSIFKQMKANPSAYPALKIKLRKGKWKDEQIQKMSGTYVESMNNLKRSLAFEYIITRRKVGKEERLYWLCYTYPEYNKTYYEPLLIEYFNSIQLPGEKLDK